MHKGDYIVTLSYLQVVILVLTVVLMIVFTLVISRTSLGRQQRACEQDRDMAALLGVNVDRTISLTFVMGAVLASVAGYHAYRSRHPAGSQPQDIAMSYFTTKNFRAPSICAWRALVPA